MSYKLVIGNGKYTFDWAGGEDNDFVPEISPEIVPVYKQGANNTRELDYYTESWELRGLMYESTAPDVWAAFNKLIEELFSAKEAPTYDCDLQYSSTTVRKLNASDAIHGLSYTDLKIEQGPGTWANNVIFSLRVTGDFKADDADTDEPSNIDRQHTIDVSAGAVREKWMVRASGPKAKDWMVRVMGSRQLVAQDAPWTDLGLSSLDTPAARGFTKAVLEERFDQDTWVATFEQVRAAGLIVDGEKHPGLEQRIENISVEGGYRVMGSIQMYDAMPMVSLSRITPILVTVTVTAICDTFDNARKEWNSINRAFPLKRFSDEGGLAESPKNVLPTVHTFDEKGEPKQYKMSTTRKYLFATRQAYASAVSNIKGLKRFPNKRWVGQDPDVP